MVQTKIWQVTLFQNLILFTKHYGNLQEMLEMTSFLRYVDLYLTSVWGRFYVGHSVLSHKVQNLLAVASDCQPNKLPTVTAYNYRHNNGVDS
jgi:hypothetical protein